MREIPLAFLALAACSGSSKYMTKEQSTAPMAPAAGKALLVFVRPSNWGWDVTFTVVDGKGEFVCQVPAKGHVLHNVAPGKHRFLLWAGNTAVVDCEVAAGRTYVIEVEARWGSWSARGHLMPVKPGGEHWAQLDEWLGNTTRWTATPEFAAKWKSDKGEGVAKQMQQADETWAKYTAEEKEARTLRPGDAR
jgi:hypothetical protein